MSSFAVPKPRRPVETTSTKQEPTSTVSPSSTLNSESPVSHSHSKETDEQEERPPPVAPPPFNYEEPEWLGVPPSVFTLEVHKDGVICEEIDLHGRSFWVVGRVPGCDIVALHPSVSRYHAIIEFKSNGLSYIYDLNSTHRTMLNKVPIPPRRHIELRPGDHIRFGQSTRSYILQGPDIREQLQARAQLAAELAQQKDTDTSSVSTTRKLNDEFANDASAIQAAMNTSSMTNQAQTDHEHAYYRQDPKKALRTYLEHRGYDMEFEIESEQGNRTFTARIRLPVHDEDGLPIYASGTGSRKRDAEREAALDAMIKLDAIGALNTPESQAERSKRRMKALLDADIDSDDDSFYDRTERRAKRTRTNKPAASAQVDTYETLLEKRNAAQKELEDLKRKLHEADIASNRQQAIHDEEADELDIYMKGIQQDVDEKKKDAIRANISNIEKNIERLNQLIAFTRPDDWSTLGNNTSTPSTKDATSTPSSSVTSPSADTKTTSTPSTSFKAPKRPPTSRPVQSRPRISLAEPEPSAVKLPAPPPIPTTQSIDLEEDVVEWVPPSNQTGDGRTALNDKFGY